MCFKRRLDSYYIDLLVCLCDNQAQPQSTDQSSILWQHRLTSGAGLHSVTHSDTWSGSPLPVAFRRDQRPVSVCHSSFVPVLPSRWQNGGGGVVDGDNGSRDRLTCDRWRQPNSYRHPSVHMYSGVVWCVPVRVCACIQLHGWGMLQI